MSRFDYRDPAFDSEYCDGLKATDDIDVPDFDAPDPPVDPAEAMTHLALSSIHSVSELVDGSEDLERVYALRTLLRDVWHQVDMANHQAAAKIDLILERRR